MSQYCGKREFQRWSRWQGALNPHVNDHTAVCIVKKHGQEEYRLITHTAAIGPRNTVYPLMNDKNLGAEASISQGHKAHPPIKAQMTCPLRILMY